MSEISLAIITITGAIVSAYLTAFFGIRLAISRNKDLLLNNNKLKHIHMENEIKNLEAKHERDIQRLEERFTALVELFKTRLEAIEQKLADLKQEIISFRGRYGRD